MKITKIYNTPLKYMLIVLASILALAIIFGAIFGVNTSTELSGGSQIKIDVTDLNAGQVLGSAKNTLSKNHLIVEGNSVENNGTKTYLVINVTSRKIANSDEIRTQIATNAGIDESKVLSFKTISPAFKPLSIVLFGVGVLVAIIVVFVVALFRYKLNGALTIGLANLVNIILYLSILILTRIWVNSASLVSLVISMIITNILVVSLLENIRNHASLKQYAGLNEKEITVHFAEKLFIPSVFVCGALCLMSVALLFVINAYVQLFALSLMVASLISFFISQLLSVSVYYNLLSVFNLKRKQKSSKNVNSKK
ncbi:MAG: hypothetical protein IJT25_01960 [Clostridia bacterium]|nr:hypothetical protein [Clostridia bacterium]